MASFKGQIIHKEIKEGTSARGDWKSIIYVIEETNAQYPESGVFECFGDKVEEREVGDRVEIQFNMRSNEYNGRYFNKLSIWKMEMEATQTHPAAAKKEENDDLPF